MGLHNIEEISPEGNGALIQLFFYGSLKDNDESYGLSIISDSKLTTINLSDYGKSELIKIKRHIENALEQRGE